MISNHFAAIGCVEPFLSTLSKRGFQNPTQVQIESFPPGLEGRDLIVQSCTGSGKTLAFGLPILHRLNDDKYHQAIVLTPTRELAQQVGEEIKATSPLLEIALLVGGLNYSPQIKSLKCGSRLVVGTPGRINDHINRGTLDLSRISMVVLDECDEMLNMGFIDEVEEILSHIPKSAQMFLFSATLPNQISNLAKKFLKNPFRIVQSQGVGISQHADIKHTSCLVSDNLQTKALVNFLLVDEPSSALIFTKMKVSAKSVAQFLKDIGFSADCLHGDLSQQARNEILSAFKNGKLKYLVATDVAARGIDVEAMPLVVHMGIPHQMENYIHRSGRTGRAGSKGSSLALVNYKESCILKAWSRRGQLNIEWRNLPNKTEIQEINTRKLIEKINTIDSQEHIDIAKDMLSKRDPESLVSALLSTIIGTTQVGYDITEKLHFESEKNRFRDNKDRHTRDRQNRNRTNIKASSESSKKHKYIKTANADNKFKDNKNKKSSWNNDSFNKNSQMESRKLKSSK